MQPTTFVLDGGEFLPIRTSCGNLQHGSVPVGPCYLPLASIPSRDAQTESAVCYSMRMSTLERRVQILLDPAQYEDVEREALRTGQSVAAVIRGAISARLASGSAARAAAAQRLLASADPDTERGEDWSDSKAALAEQLVSKSS